MYSELMMREQGFDDAPALPGRCMHTDAIWRACRIILDVRMHRGELERRRGDRVPGRADELRAAPTPGPRSSWYTYTPDLPAVVPARQDAAAPAARRRAAPARRRVLDLKAFHDTLLRNGSLPISFHAAARHAAGDGRACSRA